MTRIAFVVMIIVLGMSGMGCATIVNGTTQKISVSSDPPGATVTVDGNEVYTTPATIKVSRKRDHVVTIAKEGFATEQIPLIRTLSGAVAGNILAGGLIGWGVDAISGAQFKIMPKTITVSMKPDTGGVRESIDFDPLSAESRLLQLKRLHDQGALTDKEYEATRKIILKELTSNGAD